MYLPRLIDTIIPDYLEAFGAISIRGPKWCGKTTTASMFSKSMIQLQSSSYTMDDLKNPELIIPVALSGEHPRLIDEWQTLPGIWDAVRTKIDTDRLKGGYILTGSAVPADDGYFHSGIGRIARLTMYPMSLFESQDSNGQISLMDLFNGKTDFSGNVSTLSIAQLAYVICRGGWPNTTELKEHLALLTAQEYYAGLCESDVSRVDGVKRNPERVDAVLRSYARNISTFATKELIYQDVLANDVTLSLSTLNNYIDVLTRLYVIEDIPAWNPNVRSKTSMRSGNKRGFVDPSLAVAALGLNPDSLMAQLRYFGFLFESLCIRDLRIYAMCNDGRISYYHDRNNLECDVVIHLRDGRYGLIEIKLGSGQIEDGARNLTRLRTLLIDNGFEPPTFMMVLTGGQFAYEREDGVLVVPIGCLRN